MVEESVRKTAAKKTVRKAVGRTAAVKRAPRTRKVAGEEVEATPATRPRRKAPTPVAESVTVSQRSRTFTLIGVGAFVLLFLIGAGIGFTDKGVINVKAVIEGRISNAAPEERARLEQAQNAASNNQVDGGLILSDTQAVPPPVATTTTASSTDVTATSTEAVASSTDVVASSDELVPTDTPVTE